MRVDLHATADRTGWLLGMGKSCGWMNHGGRRTGFAQSCGWEIHNVAGHWRIIRGLYCDGT